MTDAAQEPTPTAARTSPLAALRETAVLPGLLLALFSLVSALVLSVASNLTEEAIAARKAEDLQASLAQVIPADLHDNDPASDPWPLTDEAEGTLAVYRATRAGHVTATAFTLTGQGYAGGIEVLIGIDPEGTILGVRVLSHSETPGLGDKIEAAKSDWIRSFDGKALGNPEDAGWMITGDGGIFDQFSGASMTPRAVVGTVHRGLALFARHRTALLTLPGATPEAEAEAEAEPAPTPDAAPSTKTSGTTMSAPEKEAP